MSFSPIPDLCVHDIFALTPALLGQKGITLLLLDLDNTLAPYSESEPSQKVLDWMDRLRLAGIDLFLVSNSRRGKRAENYARACRIPYISRAGKPNPRGPLTAMARMGKRPGETALAGDQVFTDVLAANRAGILSVAVEPIDMHNPLLRLRYIAERPFRLLCKERRS